MTGASAARGILDTSTVILLERIGDVATLPDEPIITAITLAELSVGPLVAADDAERAVRQLRLQHVESDLPVLPFDAAAARAFGAVAASLRRSGRKLHARAYDAMIAAIAIATDLPLFTVNPRDFSDIDRLDLRDVPHPLAGR